MKLLPLTAALAAASCSAVVALPSPLQPPSHQQLTFQHASDSPAAHSLAGPAFELASWLTSAAESFWQRLTHSSSSAAAAAAAASRELQAYLDSHEWPGNNVTIRASGPVFVTYGDQDNGNALGVPENPAVDLKGWTHYNIAFLLHSGPADNAAKWARGSKSRQAALRKKYNDAGIKLMVAAFGATDKPQSSGMNAKDVANYLAEFVINNNLDGVDIDYEEFDLMAKRASLPWLLALQRNLRLRLPSPQYVISHAPVAPWFGSRFSESGYAIFDDKMGSTVDYYSIQMYNQGGIYANCNSMLYSSGGYWPQSSLFEIHDIGGVPLERLVIGKPATKQDADPENDGWLSPASFGQCLSQARQRGWNTGFMYWEYPNASLARLNNVKVNAGWPADGY